MENTKTFWRPVWTCGRYDAEHKAAIMYNLIEGMSYYFEDYSASVIGIILGIPRNGHTAVEAVAEATGIAVESILPFIEELAGCGLVSFEPITDEIIKKYRSLTGKSRKGSAMQEKPSDLRLPVAHTTAEADYTARTGGITSAMFELTYRCSERCIHCYNPGAARNDKEHAARGDRMEMTLEDYKRVIDELYSEGLTKVCLSGGDPFSKAEVWDIIGYLYSKDIAFDVYTNGQMLYGHEDRLAAYYPRVVGLSIYSGIGEIHDAVTNVSGSFEKTVSVAERLSELGVPMNIKCCVMRPNLKSYRSVEDIAKRTGAVTQYEVNVTDSVEGDRCVSRFLRLSAEEYEIVLRDGRVPLYVGKEVPNYGGSKRPADTNPCGAAENSFCISPEGYLMPCCSFHLIFGDLKKQTLKDSLQDRSLEKWRKTSLRDYEECGRYDYCDYCNLCPGLNYSEHGSPLKPAENNCYLAKIRYNLARKLMAGDDPLRGRTVDEALAELENVAMPSLHRVSDSGEGGLPE